MWRRKRRKVVRSRRRIIRSRRQVARIWWRIMWRRRKIVRRRGRIIRNRRYVPKEVRGRYVVSLRSMIIIIVLSNV